MSKPALLVLAAGIGSRYGGLKQVDPVGPSGEIVMDYSIYDAWRAGFGKVVFIIRPEMEASFRERFDKLLGGRLETAYALQRQDELPGGFKPPADRQKPWGTGHAIWCARHCLRNDAFAVVNADDFYGPGAYGLLGDFLKNPGQQAGDGPLRFCMVAYILRNTLTKFGSVARGVCRMDADGFLAEVVERTRIEAVPPAAAKFLDEAGNWQALTADEFVSMNMWGFTPRLFAHLESRMVEFLRQRGGDLKAEFFIPTVVDEMIKARACTVRMLTTAEKWVGMTYKEDKAEVVECVDRLVAQGAYPSRLWG